MPLSFADVYNLYREADAQGAGIAKQGLSGFAKDLNVWTGSQDFNAANTGALSGAVKKASYWADKGLEATRLPEATGWLGEKAAGAVGVDPEFGREVGSTIPRMAVDFAPMIVAGALAAGSAPVSIPTGIALAGSGALSAANAWEKTSEPWQAATGFAMPFVGAGASQAASGVSSALLSRLSQFAPSLAKVGLTGGTTVAMEGGTQKVAKTVADKLADYVAGNVGATLGTEALERGVNGSPGYDFLSKESLLANAIGNLPFAVHDLKKLTTDVPIPGTARRIELEAAPVIERPQADLATKFKDLYDRLNPPKPADDKVMGFDKLELKTLPKNDKIVLLDPVRQELVDKINTPLPAKVETPQQMEDVIIQAGATDPNVTNAKVADKVIARVNDGESPAKAAQREAQAIRNKAERGLSPTQKAKMEKEGQVMGDLFTRAKVPEDVEAQQILAAIKPIYDNPDEHFTRNDIDKSQLKPELPSEIANIYNEWEIARKNGTPFGKSAEAKPIAGLPFDQQLGVLVGSLKNYINTYGFKMPKEVARGEGDKPLVFNTRAEAETKLAEMGEDYKVGAYGKGKFAVFKKTPAMAVSKADVDVTTAVVDELVNSAVTANAENLGTAERGVGELHEEVIENKLADTPDSALVEAVFGDPELMKLIDSNKDFAQVKKTLAEGGLSEEDAARTLVEQIVSKSGKDSTDALKKVLRNLMVKEVSEQDAFIQKQREAQKAAIIEQESAFEKAFLGYEDEAGNDVPGYLEQSGQVWTPKDKNTALAYANPTSEKHQEAVAYFNHPNQQGKKALLDKFLSEQAPQQVRAMLARVKAGEGFAYTMVPFDPLLNKLGRHPLPKGSMVEVKAFKRMAAETGELKDAEIDFYKQLVPEAFEGEKVNVRALAEGLAKKGPVVETKKLGESVRQKPAYEQELAELTHNWYDLLPEDAKRRISSTTNEGWWKETGISDEDVAKARRWRELSQQRAGDFSRFQDDANYSWLSPVAESEMQGYVEGLVRVPLGKRTEGAIKSVGFGRTEYKYPGDPADPLYSGPHFGSEDTNVLAFFRGFETTLPDGRKAFRVIEVQSDWGQGRKKAEAKEREGGYRQGIDFRDDDAVNDHPLLSVYESLALKAAIKHAQEVGADVLLLDDAETVMMTEGHDKQGGEPSQSAGMRLHYDTTLPSELKRLTGEKGEVMDAGIHNKAYEYIGDRAPTPEDVPDPITGLYKTTTDKLVGSPVFRNTDGTPKTNSTSLAFSLKKVPNKEFSLFNSRFLLGGQKALNAPSGNLIKAKALQAGRDFFKLSDIERNRIWKETGWVQAPDGKWRFEIDDSKSKLLKHPKDLPPGKGLRLEDTIDHSELFEKYPALKDIYVGRSKETVGPDGKVTKATNDYSAVFYPGFHPDGTLDPRSSVIVMDPKQYDARGVLLHELQHAIQDIEGFASGASSDQLILAQSLPESSRAILKERIKRDFANAGRDEPLAAWTAEQWDHALISRYGNHLYEATLGEVEARRVADRSTSSQDYNNRFAPFRAEDTKAPYFTILDGLGTSFSVQENAPTRLNSKQHFEMPGFVKAFGLALENRGVDFETAREIAGKMNSFLPSMNLDNVQFGALVNDIKAGREVLGLTTVSGPMRKMWLAIDQAGGGKVDAHGAARDALIALAHESGHVSEWLWNNGRLDQEGMRAHSEAEQWFGNSPKEDVAGVLDLMRESFLPKEWQELPAMKSLMEYTSDPKEAMATAYGLWNLGMASKGIDATLLGSVAPRSVRNWLRDVTNRALDVVSSLKTALGFAKENGTKARRDQVDQLVKNFQKIKRNLEKGQENLDKVNALASVDSSSFELLRTSDIDWQGGSPGQQAIRAMLGRKKPPSDLAEGVYRTASRFGEYLEQMAARVKPMAEAAWSVLSAPGEKHSSMQRVMNPYVGEFDPMTSRPKTGKERSEQLKMLSENENLRNIISDIKRFQNREERFFEPQKDVQFASRIAALPVKERKAVEMYLAASKVKTKIEQQEILAFNERISTFTGAKILSSFNPDGHELHISSVELLQQAEMARKQGDLQGAANALAQADAQIGNVVARDAALKFVQDSSAARERLAQMFANRPWFSSEIQTGKWRVIGYDKNGTRIGTVAAETEGDVVAVERELRKQGAEKFDRQEIQRGFHFEMDDSYRKLLESVQMRMEQSLNQNLNKAGVNPADVHEMVQDMNLIGHMEQFSRASNPVAPQTRRLSKQAESLDMIATDKRYSKMMANVLVNALTKSKMEFEMMNPKTKPFEKEKQTVKESLKNYLQPDSELGKMIVKVQSPYLLGLNIPNHLAEMFQSLHTILPEAIRETGSVGKSAKVLGGVLKDLTNFYIARPFKGGKEAWDHWGSVEEKRMMEKLGEEGLMTRHAYNEGLDDEGMAGTMSRYRATGSKLGGFVASKAKAYSDFTMGVYENFTRFNMRVASLMGYRMARAKGMSHESAIVSARRFAVTTTFSSGRVGRPTALFGGNDNTLGMIAYAMQRYSLGWMGMFGRHLQHSLVGPERANELGLSNQDRTSARKAAATMATVQFASAGALGLPFVGAMTTILEKMLGENIKGDVYKWFGEMMDEDNEEGGMLADVLMRGAANAMLDRAGVPIDLASKFALGGTPGFSELQGFDSGSIFGPTASLVKSLSLGVQSLARDGDVAGFARQAFPPGLRKAVDLLANGDATSREGSKLGLDAWNQKLYALGFTPDKVRKMRDFERFNDANEIKRRRESAKQGAEILSLLENDPAGAMMKAQELVQQSDGSLTLKEIANAVAEQAVKKQFPKDPRSEVTRADQGPAAMMLKGMGLNLGDSQELEKAQLKNEVLSMFGIAPRQTMRPAMVDQASADDPWLASFAGAGQ